MEALKSFKFFESRNQPGSGLELPFNYRSSRRELGRRPIGFRFSKYIINLTAQFDRFEVVVCGEDDCLEIAEAKAYSELVERSMLVALNKMSGETIETNFTNSNGWAAHPDRHQAELNSIFELIERDAVLSHWYS